MLTLRRRHQANCTADPKGKLGDFSSTNSKDLKKCECTLWAVGTDDKGKMHREALKTRDTATAAKKLRDLEAGKPVRVTDLELSVGWEKYKVEDLQAQRGVTRSSIKRFYNAIGSAIVNFCVQKGAKTFSQVSKEIVNTLVATWVLLSPGVRAQRIRVTKDFFKQAEMLDWGVTKNPAEHLRTPKRDGKGGKTKPYNDDEDKRLIANFSNWNHRNIQVRVTDFMPTETGEAFLWVLRSTALRISDAILFEPRNLEKRIVKGKKIWVYWCPWTLKTGEPVFIPIMKEVGDIIVNAPRLTEEFAFYNPEGTTAGTDEREDHLQNWQGKILHNIFKNLEKVTGVDGVAAHRFRDTFSVECLSNNVDIRMVSRFLGHKKISTTLDYYEHFIKSDQDKACAAILELHERKAIENAATALSTAAA